MKGTANTDTGGRFCGRAVHGASSLTLEDLRQIEAHRAKDRPTPWPHLALRYGVNEIDLRQLCEPKNDNAPRVPPPPPVRPALTEREARFRTLWVTGAPKSEIADLMGMSHGTLDKMRIRLGLAPRRNGVKPNDWTPKQDAYIRRHYVVGGETAEVVGKALGRTRFAVIGRAHRQGWSRHTLKGVPA